jgi:hypothetical protein
MVETMLREVLGSKRAVASTRNEAEVETKLIDILKGEGAAAGDDPKTMSDDELKKRLGITK